AARSLGPARVDGVVSLRFDARWRPPGRSLNPQHHLAGHRVALEQLMRLGDAIEGKDGPDDGPEAAVGEAWEPPLREVRDDLGLLRRRAPPQRAPPDRPLQPRQRPE